MWIKKNTEELEISNKNDQLKKKIIKRKNLIIGGFTILLLQFLYHKFGFAVLETKPKDWNETFILFPRMILFTIVGILFFELISFPKGKEDKIYICMKCNSKKYNIKGISNCNCGGEYIDMDLLKWVEDESLDKKNPDNMHNEI